MLKVYFRIKEGYIGLKRDVKAAMKKYRDNIENREKNRKSAQNQALRSANISAEQVNGQFTMGLTVYNHREDSIPSDSYLNNTKIDLEYIEREKEIDEIMNQKILAELYSLLEFKELEIGNILRLIV